MLLTGESMTDLVFDVLLIVEYAADDFHTLLSLLFLLLFDQVDVFPPALWIKLRVENDPNTVDDFLKQLLYGLHVVHSL